jgi:hypothetical protein
MTKHCEIQDLKDLENGLREMFVERIADPWGDAGAGNCETWKSGRLWAEDQSTYDVRFAILSQLSMFIRNSFFNTSYSTY